MSSFRGSLVLSGVLTLILCVAVQSEQPRDATPQPEGKKQVRLDSHGDALPHGALARMGSVRFRQGSQIMALGFSPDGKLLASLGADAKVHLWDAAGGRILRKLPIENNENEGGFGGGLPGSFRFSADGKSLTLLGMGRLLAWETASGKKLDKFEELAGTIMAISADGKTVVTGQDGNNGRSYHLWDLESGKEISQLQEKAAQQQADDDFMALQNFAFSPDGKTVAAGRILISEKKKVEDSKEESKEEPKKDSEEEPDDGDPDEDLMEFKVCIRAWDAVTGKQLWETMVPQAGEMVTQVRYAPDGKTLAWLGAGTGTLSLLDAATGKEIRQIHGGDINNGEMISSFVFTADSKSLILANNLGSLQKTDVAAEKEEKRWKGHEAIFCLALAADGKTLAYGDSSTIHLFDTVAWKPQSLGGHDGPIQSIALSADGKTLLSAGADHTVRAWDTATGKEARRFDFSDMQTDGATLTRASLSPGGKILAATVSKLDPNTGLIESGTIHLYDTVTSKKIREFSQAGMSSSSLVFSHDGKLLASACSDGMVRLYDLVQGKEFRQIEVEEFKNNLLNGDDGVDDDGLGLFNIGDLAFAPDGKTLITRGYARAVPPGEDMAPEPDPTVSGAIKVRVWEIASGKERRNFSIKGSSSAMNIYNLGVAQAELAISPEMSFEQSIMSSMVISPHGKTVAFSSGNTLQLYDLEDAKELRQFGGASLNTRSAAFSPDGKHLAAGTFDGHVRIWEVDTGTVVCQLPGHQGNVNSLVYAASGKTLITGSADSTALVWDVAAMIEETRAKPVAVVPAEKLASLWADLAAEDAAKADLAMRALASDPKQAAPFLKKMLKPAQADAGADPQAIERLIEQLDSNDFNEREKATRALENLGRLAEPALRQASAKQQHSLEMRRRLEVLMEKLGGPVTSPETLQGLRSLEVLERIGTAEAREVLEAVAKGASDAGLTLEAKASLERLSRLP